jgi:hypothetical protein
LKKSFLSAFLILLLSSLLLLMNVGPSRAYNASYSYQEWGGFTITFDGKWTTSTEWAAAPFMDISENAQFRGVIDKSAGTIQYNLIDFINDTTNDADDYWQICLSNDEYSPNNPSFDTYRIELVGHTTVHVYQGNTATWNTLGTIPTGFSIVESMSTSPLSSTPHWTCEIKIDRVNSPITDPLPNGIRVAVYDASNPTAGEEAWPPNSERDNPSTWGTISGYAGDIPEGFSSGGIVLLSTVAIMVGYYYLRRRPKFET